MTAVWAVLAILAGGGAVAVRRRRDLPRRRLALSLLWTLAVLSALLALQGVVMVTAAGAMLVGAAVLASRRGLREPGGRFTGRGLAVLLLLGSGALLLVFAVGAATQVPTSERHTPTPDPLTRGLEAA